MAFKFGGGSSGGGGASGVWDAPQIVQSSPAPTQQQKKQENKKTQQGSSNQGSSSYIGGVGGGGNLFNDIFLGGTVQTRGGGFTPDGSYSAGFHGVGPPAGPTIDQQLAEWTGGQTLADFAVTDGLSQGLWDKYISSIDVSNMSKRIDFNRKLSSLGASPSLLIGSDFEKDVAYPGWQQKLLGKAPNLLDITSNLVAAEKPTPIASAGKSALESAKSLFNNLMSAGKDLFKTISTNYTPTYSARSLVPQLNNAFQQASNAYNKLIKSGGLFNMDDVSNINKGTTVTAKTTPTPTPTPMPTRGVAPSIKNQVAMNVAQIVPSYAESAKKNVPVLIDAMYERGVTNPNAIAYGIATAVRESGLELSKDEIRANPNVQPGLYNTQSNYEGGWDYHGRGPIQLTGKTNYAKYGEAIGMGDALVKNPDLANQPDVAAKIFAEYLKQSGTAEAANQGNYYGARKYVNPYDYETYGPIASQAQAIRNTMQGF